MQGWRISNEDAHVCSISNDFQLFGVFDGHGGCEVAKFASKQITNELKKNYNFKQKEY